MHCLPKIMVQSESDKEGERIAILHGYHQVFPGTNSSDLEKFTCDELRQIVNVSINWGVHPGKVVECYERATTLMNFPENDTGRKVDDPTPHGLDFFLQVATPDAAHYLTASYEDYNIRKKTIDELIAPEGDLAKKANSMLPNFNEALRAYEQTHGPVVSLLYHGFLNEDPSELFIDIVAYSPDDVRLDLINFCAQATLSGESTHGHTYVSTLDLPELVDDLRRYEAGNQNEIGRLEEFVNSTETVLLSQPHFTTDESRAQAEQLGYMKQLDDVKSKIDDIARKDPFFRGTMLVKMESFVQKYTQ